MDVHLTEEGIKQSGQLAEKLKDIPFEVIYISELPRTKQTAEVVNKSHDVQLKVDARLNDNRTGFEDRPVKEYLDVLYASKDMWTVKLNDGESLEDVRQRVQSFIDGLKKQNYKTVLIVTSQMILQYINAVVNDLSNEQSWNFDVAQGSFIEFDI